MKLNGRSKLPATDRAEMRKLRDAKPWLWSFEALAQHFGTTKWTAMKICKQDAA